MSLNLSYRISQISESKTQKISMLATTLRESGKDIIGFAVGEPDFDTPDNVKEVAIQAIRDGYTKYTAVDGLTPCKQAVVDKLKRENNLEYKLDEVIVSCGAKQVIYNLCQSILNPGDEAIIPTPYWVSYPDIVTLSGGASVYVSTSAENGFKMTAKELRDAITDKTRLVFINSPSNPSGSVYTADELKELSTVLLEHPQIAILSDDIYEHLVYGDVKFANIANACPELKDRTIVINGVSKAYAMTGWRIGYAAGAKDVIVAMKKVQSQSTSCANSIAQYASIEALNNSFDFVKDIRGQFAERNQIMLSKLQDIPGMKCHPSDGSFYTFPNAEAFIGKQCPNDIELARYLLEKAHVAVVPGSAFGAPNHLRFSFSCGQDTINEGLDRVKKALAELD